MVELMAVNPLVLVRIQEGLTTFQVGGYAWLMSLWYNGGSGKGYKAIPKALVILWLKRIRVMLHKLCAATLDAVDRILVVQ